MMQHDTMTNSPPKFIFANPVYIYAGHHYEPHTHPHNELIVVQRGCLRARLANNEHIASPGMILFYPARVLHEEWAEDGDPVLTWACHFAGTRPGLSHPLYVRDARGRVQELVALLTSVSLIAGFPVKEEAEYCAELLYKLIRELRLLAAHEPDAMVEHARIFMRENMRQPFTLEEVAAAVGLSKSYFVRQYRALTGRTPMEDVRFIRAEEARRLILSTTLSLSEIAPKVGVSDEFGLSRLLKAVLGIGAREMRRAAQTPPTGL